MGSHRHNTPLSQGDTVLIDVYTCAVCVRHTVGASSVVGSLNLEAWKLVALSTGLGKNVCACTLVVQVPSVEGDVVRIAPAHADTFG